MSSIERDEARKDRIHVEAIVDAYDPEEQATGWYSYLEDKRNFPFLAECIVQRLISPLRVGDEVEVLEMAPQSECEHEMFVVMRWDRKEGLAVPLSQLQVIDADDETTEGVKDWQYWVNRGYEL
jgi:hypothetical protein